MQRFDSWEDVLAHYGALTLAEQRLRASVKSGQRCILGSLPPPTNWTALDPNRHIRADILSFVLTLPPSSNEKTHMGVGVIGGLISGSIDLANQKIHGNTAFVGCRFQSQIDASRAHFDRTVDFSGSHLHSIVATGLRVDGNLSFIETTFPQKIYIPSAIIKGSISFGGANASRSPISLMKTEIEGQLSFRGASFASLNLQSAVIKDVFIFCDIARNAQVLDLTDTTVRGLADDKASWAKVERIHLDGLRYDRITGKWPVADHKSRLKWLEHSDDSASSFRPHPYTQLAKVLKEMGHERDAREIRVALARKLAKEDWYETHERWMERELLFEARYPLGEWIGRFLHKCVRLSVTTSKSCWNWLFRNVVGYGYKPFNSLWFLLGLIVAAWILAYSAWHEGQFAPNSAPVLVSQGWLNIKDDPMAAIKWSEPFDKVENPKGGGGQDWESFNSFAYAADIVIPIVEIGQTSAWAPSSARGPWAWTLWWARWFFTATGWIISALGAAAITGVIRRE